MPAAAIDRSSNLRRSSVVGSLKDCIHRARVAGPPESGGGAIVRRAAVTRLIEQSAGARRYGHAREPLPRRCSLSRLHQLLSWEERSSATTRRRPASRHAERWCRAREGSYKYRCEQAEEAKGFLQNAQSQPHVSNRTARTYPRGGRYLVSLRLLRLTATGLGLDEGHFEGELTAGPVIMNVNHYVPCPDPSLTMGLAPHCDPNVVTVLLDNGVRGLQARQRGGGGGWVNVEPLPGALVVNFGHQMEDVAGHVRPGASMMMVREPEL
ncbi:hypothetical protein C2845_PM11G21500 [Panicum miliaceum]|uniref:Fe2OG dioxygenase domain-containing protein n=1 Tax=Panicum miliaceum TaxID=4540 RepID=A0A3L6RQ02_PANMI|nr:hypothetical protein C2845_PM11G21500 [Panicum miliaceum]